jgi:dihydrofolate synthase/folylpolyglutamate synthase
LNVSKKIIIKALADIQWKARLEVIKKNPTVILDVAHNPSAFRILKSAITEIYSYEKLFLILGIMKDKNYKEICEIICPIADVVYAVQPETERALAADKLAKEIQKYTKAVVIKNVYSAYKDVMKIAKKNDLVVITGSHFTVGEFITTNER